MSTRGWLWSYYVGVVLSKIVPCSSGLVVRSTRRRTGVYLILLKLSGAGLALQGTRLPGTCTFQDSIGAAANIN